MENAALRKFKSYFDRKFYMSKVHVEKFGEVLLSDPDMSEKLGLSKFLDSLDANDSDAQIDFKATFVDNAVKEATSRGLIFSKEEFTENLDIEVLAMQSGELSDLQLEAVAGGKECDGVRVDPALLASATAEVGRKAGLSASPPGMQGAGDPPMLGGVGGGKGGGNG